MTAMRFEQAQRFILAKSMLWGKGHFKTTRLINQNGGILTEFPWDLERQSESQKRNTLNTQYPKYPIP